MHGLSRELGKESGLRLEILALNGEALDFLGVQPGGLQGRLGGLTLGDHRAAQVNLDGAVLDGEWVGSYSLGWPDRKDSSFVTLDWHLPLLALSEHTVSLILSRQNGGRIFVLGFSILPPCPS